MAISRCSCSPIVIYYLASIDTINADRTVGNYLRKPLQLQIFRELQTNVATNIFHSPGAHDCKSMLFSSTYYGFDTANVCRHILFVSLTMWCIQRIPFFAPKFTVPMPHIPGSEFKVSLLHGSGIWICLSIQHFHRSVLRMWRRWICGTHSANFDPKLSHRHFAEAGRYFNSSKASR